MLSLSNQQKRFLKSKSHSLKPVVIIAGNGLTENVLAAIEEALEIHELIKIKLKTEARADKKLLTANICSLTKATEIQIIGHILTIFRHAKTPKMVMPKK